MDLIETKETTESKGGVHGKEAFCPTCQAPGRYDHMGKGNGHDENEFDNAIWFNGNSHCGWECWECWLK